MGELVHIYGRGFLNSSGGAEDYVRAHLMAASRAGYRPHIFVVGGPREDIDLGYATIHRVPDPLPTTRPEYAVFHRPWYARAIAAFLRDRPGPHLLHAYGPWVGEALAIQRRLADAGVAIAIVATSFEVHDRNSRAKLENRLVRRNPRLLALHLFEWGLTRFVTLPIERRGYASSVVVVNYESVRRTLEQYFGSDLKIVKLPYAPSSAFEPEPDGYRVPADIAGLEKQDGPLVATTSRHTGRKGLDTLIRALAVLRDEGVAFRAALVGTGMLLSTHRQLVDSFGLADRVAFPGRVPDVRPYLHHADVFALPSIAEGSGSVSLLEAFQAGLAVVSTDVDGMSEDITGDVDGVLVGAGSVDELVRGLRPVLTDAALRARLGAAARDLYERRFSADALVDALASLYTAQGVPPAVSSAA